MESFLFTSERTEERPLISVCCICQRQQTSVDTWEPFDISEDNSEIDMTHGFCPDCIREHYPRVSHKLETIRAELRLEAAGI